MAETNFAQNHRAQKPGPVVSGAHTRCRGIPVLSPRPYPIRIRPHLREAPACIYAARSTRLPLTALRRDRRVAEKKRDREKREAKKKNSHLSLSLRLACEVASPRSGGHKSNPPVSNPLERRDERKGSPAASGAGLIRGTSFSCASR